MDRNVRSMFDELFKRFDNFDKWWAKWEKRFTNEKSGRKEKDKASRRRQLGVPLL
jgi:hypothetical protein